MPQDEGQDVSGSGGGFRGRSGRTLVEPTGYAVTSFLSSAGLTGGIGLAPDGLLLFAAAVLLSVIEWRRLREANPWLRLETPEDFRTHEGKIFLRYSAWGTGIGLGLAAAAFALVQMEGREAAASGPALISGVATLVLNYLLKRKLAKPLPPLGQVDRMGGDVPDDRDDDARDFPAPWTSDDVDSPDRLDDRADAGSTSGTHPDRHSYADRHSRGGDDAHADRHSSTGQPAAEAPDDDEYRPGGFTFGDEHGATAPRLDEGPEPTSRSGDDEPDGDGFLEQDETALHGKLLEPRSAPKARTKRGFRRGDDR